MLVSSKVVNQRFDSVEFFEHVLCVNRVSKTTKGGRTFSFSVIVIVGNNNGYFGIGLGKSREVGDARKKAINIAKKNLYYVLTTKSGTIPHAVEAKYCSSSVIIRPAKPGSGIIAGAATRVILEAIGIKDVVAKCIGSSNPYNLMIATLHALMKLKSPKYFAILRSLSQKNLDFNISQGLNIVDSQD
ncbi:MAG: hypothetical protein RL208_66 [Pseudomonadota bacterium]|jgi:small subunit ribosomal protein S5